MKICTYLNFNESCLAPYSQTYPFSCTVLCKHLEQLDIHGKEEETRQEHKVQNKILNAVDRERVAKTQKGQMGTQKGLEREIHKGSSRIHDPKILRMHEHSEPPTEYQEIRLTT